MKERGFWVHWAGTDWCPICSAPGPWSAFFCRWAEGCRCEHWKKSK